MNYRLRDLTIEVTRKCPLKCLFCSSESSPSANEMLDYREVTRVIDEALSLGVESISFSGGEPFVYPYLFESIRYIKDRRNTVEVIVYTSGNIFDGDKRIPLSKDLLKNAKDAGVDKIVFSLHGCKEEHDTLTGVEGSFENVIQSILNAKSLRINLEVHFVPTRVNYKSIKNVVGLLVALGIPSVHILRFVPQGRGKKYDKMLRLSWKEEEEFRELIRLLKSSGDIKIYTGAHYNVLFLDPDIAQRHSCTAGIEKATIMPDGGVVPCSALKDREFWYHVDSIREKTLKEIWEFSDVFVTTRNYLTRVFKEGPCSSCPLKSVCKGGCLAQRLVIDKTQPIVYPDPLCARLRGEQYECSGKRGDT